MPNFQQLPPLSLYIHIPWCVRKCPYCDFNSHEKRAELPFERYVDALLLDLEYDAALAQNRCIDSVFFGGGTPSLMPATAIARLLKGVTKIVDLNPAAEITLETNPGTAEYQNFEGYREAGVNRLSLGAQSFSDSHLRTLGRIHSPGEIENAYHLARKAGFSNINLDLMFALPNQTLAQALSDLECALKLKPEHLSWYQLTIEPNTAFYNTPPKVPDDDLAWDMHQAGQQLLAQHGYDQYEVSAYAQPEKQALHNLNYWQFGDYLAVGAGAHGKITLLDKQSITRFRKTRMPEHYLQAAAKAKSSNPFTAECSAIAPSELAFEFMMNALRLTHGVPTKLFVQRTGLPLTTLEPLLSDKRFNGALVDQQELLQVTPLGMQYLNSLLEDFLN